MNQQEEIQEIQDYLERLFPICRSITGNGNRESLAILKELIPLKTVEVPDGKEVYDWTVPKEWNISGATISSCDGETLIDFSNNNLHVVSYSLPVNETLTWEQLEPHLHKHDKLPEAIPYRTTYYANDWGFCVTHAQYERLSKHEGAFRVVIDSSLEPGSLTYGELLIPGESPKEILISSYICHPSMANDSLSGVLVAAFLARRLLQKQTRKWSYRFVFVPETIGAIAYCSENESALKDIDIGLVITTVGGPGKFGYKKSWNGHHRINSLIEESLQEHQEEFLVYPFDIHGSDERQYSTQGFRINTATICKDRYYEYDYYHSSLDNLEFVKAENLVKSLEVYSTLVGKIEARRIFRSRVPHCEPMLSRRNLYPKKGGLQVPVVEGRSELDLILWILFLSDGNSDVTEIASQLNVGEDAIIELSSRLEEQGVLERV